MVLSGRHSDQVGGRSEEPRSNHTTTLTASVGTVATSGPAGASRRTDTVTYSAAGSTPFTERGGYKPAKRTTTFTRRRAAERSVHLMYVMSAARSRGLLTVVLDDVMPQADVDYFKSIDGSNVWVTLNRSLTGTHKVSIQTH